MTIKRMKRKFLLLGAAFLGLLYLLGLGSCIQEILFGVAPLLL
jgi:hypothetical protein